MQLLARANQLAHYLSEDAGLLPGQRVLLRGPNNPWLVACWFAVLKAGGVVVLTVPMLRSGEITPLIELTRASLALCDSRFTADLAPAVTAAGIPMLNYGGGGRRRPDRAVRRQAGRRSTTSTPPPTTSRCWRRPRAPPGRPKATMHFHRDVLAIADTFGKHVVAGRPDDVFTGTPPLAFTFGLGGLLVFPLRIGASALLIERATPTELAEAVERLGATVLFTAPTAYRAILRAGQQHRLATRAPRGVGRRAPAPAGVAGVPRQDRHPAHRRHRQHRDAARVHLGRRRRHPARRDRQGGARLHRDGARRRRQSGARRHAGRLAVVGPDRLPLPRRPPAGHLRAAPVERHRRHLHPRLRRLLLVPGPQRRHDRLLRATTSPRPRSSGRWSSTRTSWSARWWAGPTPNAAPTVHAVVVLREGAAQDAAKVSELQDFTKQTIAPYKYPRSIEFVAALPRTSTGKVQRFRLREPEAAR